MQTGMVLGLYPLPRCRKGLQEWRMQLDPACVFTSRKLDYQRRKQNGLLILDKSVNEKRVLIIML